MKIFKNLYKRLKLHVLLDNKLVNFKQTQLVYKTIINFKNRKFIKIVNFNLTKNLFLIQKSFNNSFKKLQVFFFKSKNTIAKIIWYNLSKRSKF